MGNNLPVYLLDADETRDAEYTGTPFQDTESASYNARLGCNKAGSNAPGIGIATGVANPKAADFPQTADTAAKRSQHIGTVPDATTTLKTVEGADVNNTLAFVEADAQTADGAVADVATGATNQTGATVAANAWLHGVIPVA